MLVAVTNITICWMLREIPLLGREYIQFIIGLIIVCGGWVQGIKFCF